MSKKPNFEQEIKKCAELEGISVARSDFYN